MDRARHGSVRTTRPTRTTTAVAAALALTLAACGGDDAADEPAASDPTAEMGAEEDAGTDAASTSGEMASTSDGMASMSDDGMASMIDDDDMDMGSGDGPRADEADAEQLRRADLVVLDGAPAAFANASGTASLALDPMTWLTVDVDGLAPGTEVVGHLDAESCATDGGPHYRFDPDGSDMPPNEVHVSGTADDEGTLTVAVTNEMAADDALAVVLHATDGDTTKALCADLPPTR